MKIKILRCLDPNKWYSSLVGESVPYHGDTSTEYESREPEGYINFISKLDSILIDGPEVILESTANGVGNEFHKLWRGSD
tara:strand:+ start:10086 stop:10325 length:240 start_codon:yes stop_codon:yes gene_type:complete